MSALSIVAVGSNAGYGGNFLERMQAWANNLFEKCPKYNLDADIIVVEWNPPVDRPRIKDAIDWSKKTLPVKIITVPKSVHDGLSNPHNEKFFEYIAKNVGIRRAEGGFILSTNPDNLYSDYLLARLANLDKKCFYRANRYDIRNERIFSIHRAIGSMINGELQKSDGVVCPDVDGTVDYPNLGRLSPLHFNAAGDFLLMSKANWFKIAGHPEVPYSLTVDGQTVYLAAKNRIRQVILPEPMFHQDHTRTDKYFPAWSDRTPFGDGNTEDWGFGNVSFDTSYI